jgi:hypothetical protein
MRLVDSCLPADMRKAPISHTLPALHDTSPALGPVLGTREGVIAHRCHAHASFTAGMLSRAQASDTASELPVTAQTRCRFCMFHCSNTRPCEGVDWRSRNVGWRRWRERLRRVSPPALPGRRRRGRAASTAPSLALEAPTAAPHRHCRPSAAILPYPRSPTPRHHGRLPHRSPSRTGACSAMRAAAGTAHAVRRVGRCRPLRS